MVRRPLRLEIALVVVVALAVLAPGIDRYSLVDPWETHYGEVARVMLRDHDLVHMDWPGTNEQGDPDEGFRSKPVLTFWMMAAAMRTLGVGVDGTYSGELVHDSRTMVAIRLPFILAAVLGLVLMWLMLARLVNRRLAWLALLVVGSCPFFCLIARQGIPDMPLCATVMGAVSLFILAVEDGDRPIEPLRRVWRGRYPIDARHVFYALGGGFIVWQAIYYAAYFIHSPRIALRVFPKPAIALPVFLLVLLAATASPIWRSRHRLLRMARLTTMRQIYMLWCYAFIGVSILAKGPPGATVVAAVGVFYVVLLGKWRQLYDGAFEIKRGLFLMTAIAVPWHIAMWLKEGPKFINEYIFTHILNRATADPDKSLGTFEFYTSQLGHGMWIWAALLPAAVAAGLLRSRTDSREGRVRFLVSLWAICAVAVFSIVQTKFHHYILPAVPPLGILVAFFLDDVLAGRDRFRPMFAALGVAIMLLVARDLMWEPERWIEMFTYLYNRPWPGTAPWSVDPSDGFLVLGVCGAIAIVLLACMRRVGVAAVGLVGLASCLWALHVYMPVAGRHWGSGDAMREYYVDRTIYGEKIVYYGARSLYDDWHDANGHWQFETFIPDTVQVGQPMTITIQIVKPEDARVREGEVALVGTVAAIGDHTIDVELPAAERAKLEPWLARGKTARDAGRPPTRRVEADRLLAWHLYWRGDQFWSGGEIWDALPEMKTTFAKGDNVDFLKYLNDPTMAPKGRRYFVITDSGHAGGLRGSLPTARARETCVEVNTESNKFTLLSFYL